MTHERQTPASAERTRALTTTALMTALLVASAWITIPAGAVPITLQLLIVVLAALLLRPAWAAAAVGGYLALGAAGLPVFSGGRGGLGVLTGPTGGYLVGFVIAAAVGALVRKLIRLGRDRDSILGDVIATLAVVVCVYLVGTVQLAFVLQLEPLEAIAAGILPFILPDAGKAAAAVVVARAVRRATGR